MLIKGLTNKVRHVPRTHRIELDWLFEVLREDPGVNIKYINTKEQAADIFTKGMFTIQQWQHLAFCCNVGESSLSIESFSKLTNAKHSLPCVAQCSALYSYFLNHCDLVRMFGGDTSCTQFFKQGNRHASGSWATPAASYAIPDGMQNAYDTMGVSFNCTDAEFKKKLKQRL